MARKSSKKRSVKDWLDQATEKVDPITVAAMTLGGTACALGIQPPMTAILLSLSQFSRNFDSSNWTIPNADVISMAPGWNLLALQQRLKEQQPSDPSNPDTWSMDWLALFCSGAMEALITIELVRNKEFMKTLIGAGTTLGSAAIRAAGEAVPL